MPRRNRPPENVPHYTMSLRVHPRAGRVKGISWVQFVADRPTRRIVVRLWPNGPRLAAEGARLVVHDMSADVRSDEDLPVEQQPDPTTHVLELRRSVRPGEAVDVRIRWTLQLPGPILDRISRNGDAIRLGSFFPILAWEGRRGWATDPPTTTLAEASTSPTANFEVSIEAPQHLDVVATGEEVGPG
ncbi:MAG TPA: hypothetical protein VHN37_07570, partial [Actinomycetota bacterium]|nr:hypothetical protein [Actinomycetota bacterium]